ncbi:MAG: hypothetical protein QM817_29275 [Archangium sp.]
MNEPAKAASASASASKKKGPQLLTCTAHGAIAGWECTGCHQNLCPDCAAEKIVYPATVVVCALCGELAEELIRKKADAGSLLSRVPGAFTFPFTSFEGLAAWFGLSLWLWFVSFLGALGVVIGWGVLIGSLFGLTRSTASGKDHLELSDFQDPVTSVFGPLFRFVVAMVPAWGGALFANYTHRPWLLWVAAAITILWSPTAYIGAATGASFVDMMNPLRVLRASAAMGKDYGVYVMGLFGVLVAWVVTFLLAVFIDRVVLVPVLGGVMAHMAASYAPFVGARLAGIVLFLHGGIFGWGDKLEGFEAILKDTPPRGRVPEAKKPERTREAIELEPEAQPALAFHNATAGDRFAALELDPHSEKPPDVAPLDVALLPEHGEQATASIRQAIAAQQTDAALDGFRATGLSAAPFLTVDELLWLGQSAASHIDFESAELAFRTASTKADAPLEQRVRAKVMLARLLAEKLKKPAEGRALMEEVRAEAPGSSAATFADQWLSQQRE